MNYLNLLLDDLQEIIYEHVMKTAIHGTLASASLPLEAEEANKDKAMSALARLQARKTSSSLLAGGGEGRRLALAGRRLATRCVLVDAHGGRRGCMLGGRRWPRQLRKFFVRLI